MADVKPFGDGMGRPCHQRRIPGVCKETLPENEYGGSSKGSGKLASGVEKANYRLVFLFQSVFDRSADMCDFSNINQVRSFYQFCEV